MKINLIAKSIVLGAGVIAAGTFSSNAMENGTGKEMVPYKASPNKPKSMKELQGMMAQSQGKSFQAAEDLSKSVQSFDQAVGNFNKSLIKAQDELPETVQLHGELMELSALMVQNGTRVMNTLAKGWDEVDKEKQSLIYSNKDLNLILNNLEEMINRGEKNLDDMVFFFKEALKTNQERNAIAISDILKIKDQLENVVKEHGDAGPEQKGDAGAQQ